MMSRFAGRDLSVDEAVYASESATGDRNRALAHLLKSYDVITDAVDVVVEAYFRQCSALVTVRDLAVMAGTLAFGGVNPLNGERVVAERTARDVISIMASCGMYDFSGEWLLRVGLPAKSGVSGGLLAVAPSQFGVGAFSPRLDAHGSSVRASAAVELLSDRLGMHLFEPHELAHPGLRIEQRGDDRVVHLGGELGLAGMERLVALLRELAVGVPVGGVIVLDAAELTRAHPAATAILRAQLDDLPARFRIEE
jgi:glutaminase